MTLSLWIAYLTTLVIYMSTPGPSHLLMLSNSLVNGFRRAISTAAGDLSANVCQILIASLGLAGIITASPDFFTVVKWGGVAFLVSVGIAQMRRRYDAALAERHLPKSRKALYWQGFMTSAANPKAIVFFAALLPQFVNPGKPTGGQFFVLGLTFIVVDGAFLCVYGVFAEWITGKFRRHVGRHMSQVSGSLLIVAAILLGLRDVAPEQVR
jgi:threonine/homoserine/homoserine lactone efflux protein